MSSKRKDFVEWCESKRGVVTLWAGKGYNRHSAKTKSGLEPANDEAYDCSGLVTCGLWALHVKDMRGTHRAQELYNETPPVPLDESPQAGDLHFYGSAAAGVIHVAVDDGRGGVISASGATKSVRDYKTAFDIGTRVRVHNSPKYRPDWLAAHRNTWLIE